MCAHTHTREFVPSRHIITYSLCHVWCDRWPLGLDFSLLLGSYSLLISLILFFFFLAATCFVHFLNLEISEAMVLDCLILEKTSILYWVPNCTGLNSIPPNDIPKSRMCRWDHPGLRLGPNLMTGVLPRGRCTGTEAQRRRPCENGGRERSAVTRPQATRSWRRQGMILP